MWGGFFLLSAFFFFLQHVILSLVQLPSSETENSQSHNYRTELSISPSINPVGREGTRGERRGSSERDEGFKFGMKHPPRPPTSHSNPHLTPPHIPHLSLPRGGGCVRDEGEGITPPKDELHLTTAGQTSYYTAQTLPSPPPLPSSHPASHYQQIGPGRYSLMQT